MSEKSHIELWNSCLEIIRDNVTTEQYKAWFMPIVPWKYEKKEFWLEVPSHFFIEWLEKYFLELLRTALYKVVGQDTRLMYKVQIIQKRGGTIDIPSTPSTPDTTTNKRTKEIPQAPVANFDSHLNPNYNFETFIEGFSNKLSRSVGEAVAQNPAKTAFNPLFLHGASGVGKTHLANAIGTKIKDLYPEKKVLYVSAHLFQVQYTDSVRNNTINDFIKFYQTIDVLIIDDIQEFAGVTKTQNTFFHIFNHLHQSGKQLILTSDRAPVLLQGMEERLITRFKWGMVAELERPTIELRKNILLNKIRRDGLKFPMEVVDYIAENVGDSVRDLEGIVISIIAHSTIYNRKVDLELAQRIVRKVSNCEKKEITLDNVMELVCKHYELEESTLRSTTRKRDVVRARQIAMYLAKTYTELSTSKIGTLIGGRDHATVLHACKLIKGQLAVDKVFRKEMEELQTTLKQGR